MAKDTDQTQPKPETGNNDLMAQITAAIAMLANRPDQAEMLGVLTKALNRIADVQDVTGREAILESKRAHRPSNEQSPMRSTKNPQGDRDHNRPALKCPIFMPWPLMAEDCTYEELELVNLLEPGVYTIRRTDRSTLRLAVTAEYAVDGKTLSKLTVNTDPPGGKAFDNENAKLLPPFDEWVRQMLAKHADPKIVKAAKSVLTMDERETLVACGDLAVSA